MDLEHIYLLSVSSLFVFAAAAFVLLLKINAPYGRHHSRKFGPEIGARASWVIMEAPALICFAGVFFTGPAAMQLLPLVFLVLWQTHYIHRTLIFPFRMKLEGKKASVLTTVLAIGFNVMNGSNNAYTLTYQSERYSVEWLWDPRFATGVVIFVVGFVINRWSDSILRKLRGPGETGYKIPRTGLFRWVSCPNYLGELIEWTGWVLATWNLAALAFLVFSCANLVPRALAHHRWYKAKFPDYPTSRKAIIPGII